MPYNLEKFGGLPVQDLDLADKGLDLSQICPKLRCDYDSKHDLSDLLAVLYEQSNLENLSALIIGMWIENGESYGVSPQPLLDMMVAFKDRLPGLKALFAGEIISEENEISWIGQGNYAAIWAAFPKLEEIRIRGGNDLSLGTINHQSLRKIVIETGGLGREILHEALVANAPIEHFEMWLGVEEYGATSSVEDFGDLFAGHLFPSLHTLALRNAEYTDDLASAIAGSPLLERIKVLDLSMGTLTDKGAQALIASGKLGHLERLDISHHYVSSDVVDELAGHTPNLVADDPEKPEEYDGEVYYYTAVSE